MTDRSAGEPSAGSAVEPGDKPGDEPPDEPGAPAVADDRRPGYDPRIDPDATPDETSGAWRELSTGRRPAGEPEAAAQGMLPARRQRGTSIERGSMRVLATGGIVGLATILGAVLVAEDVAGWIVGLVIGLTSVVLAAILWSSRQL
jgi:hypothetical protein